tara:strand:+ start:226 stop:1047 length:822 start_codon:yes stop_codon:yes gene_type:complete
MEENAELPPMTIPPSKTSSTKKYFRQLCCVNIDLIRKIKLPVPPKLSKYEAVLIEFRKLNHIEFIIRNSIYKLGTRFMHTIVCSNDNYEQINDICKSIDRNIRIINIDITKATRNDYNNLLHTKEFWNKLHGEKILIHQEDSLIFHKNIEPFLNFDYIGAPWPHHKNSLLPQQGNGGFSYRSKKQILKCIDIKNEIINSEACSQFKQPKDLDQLPEDVMFSIGCILLKCNLPTIEEANKFSSELSIDRTSFAGHRFWDKDRRWVNRMKNIFNC